MLRLLCLFLISVAGWSQTLDLEEGVIHDSIWVDDIKKESIAIYLPKKKMKDGKRPVIFIFEPAARGSLGIAPFIKSADKFGYLLVCSNNSKNGPFNTNFPIADRMFRFVSKRFRIDIKRVYTSGFSGGARLACSLAENNAQITGVIACGAGFSMDSGLLPTNSGFSYAALIGTQDMNYKEIYYSKSLLARAKVPFEIFTFEINHKWPEPDQVEEAMNWMHLEEVKNQLVQKIDPIINELYSNSYLIAKDYEANDKWVLAAERYKRILKTFNRHFDCDSIQQRFDALIRSKEYTRNKKLIEQNFTKEKELGDPLIDRFMVDLEKKDPKLNWWKKEIEKLIEKESRASDESRDMMLRLRYKIYAMAIETAGHRLGVDALKQKKFCYEICTIVYPKHAYPFFLLIDLAVETDDEDQACNYFERLTATGFSNKESLSYLKSYERLMKNERFRSLVAKL